MPGSDEKPKAAKKAAPKEKRDPVHRSVRRGRATSDGRSVRR